MFEGELEEKEFLLQTSAPAFAKRSDLCMNFLLIPKLFYGIKYFTFSHNKIGCTVLLFSYPLLRDGSDSKVSTL